MNNFTKYCVKETGREELHDNLKLTGAEISINTLPAGGCVPFVHSHKQNEEIYIVLQGSGKAVIDGETVPLKENDCLRISTNGKRQFFASDKEDIKYICIQVKEGSLERFTGADAIVGTNE